MKKGDMKKQYGLILAVSLFFLTLFSCHGQVYADTGPKPSININISGLQGEKYYMTLLSKEKGTGPWGISREYEANYGEEDIWQRFSAYKDTDWYYFIGNFKDCSETNSFSWTYYPPKNFKILIYVPSRNKFIVSADNYERYAFHSYYDIEAICYNIMLYKRPSEKRLHPWLYSFTANSISLILGFILSMIAPSIF